MNKLDLEATLKSRAKKCIELASGLLSSGEYFLAGSSIASNVIRDIDCYPSGDSEFSVPKKNIVSKTKNAVTVSIPDSPVTIQFCKYVKPTLSDLLSSFDYAHIQAGAHISNGEILKVEWTDDFLFAKACSTSFYTGSDYPLSSGFRLLKYYSRSEISRKSALGSYLKIISDVVSRGFDSYEDFKDQLDAVDLGLVPDELSEIDQGSLLDLFNKLKRG